MSDRELREDPTTGAWVVLSTERVQRPLPPGIAAAVVHPQSCPFCPGHESATPPTIAQRPPGGKWVARAFSNKYPGLRVEGKLSRQGWGPHASVSGIGAHEVLVEGRAHDREVHHQPRDVLADALRLARDRMADLWQDPRVASIQWFRNRGAAAGASQSHPHAQILATPIVPATLLAMAQRFADYARRHDRDLLGDVLAHERMDGSRIVRDGAVVALCPWAPLAPFELWLVPDQPAAHFSSAPDALVDALATAMHDSLGRLAAELDDPPYNALLYEAPREQADGFRWHMRLRPRVTHLAGFELATGGAMHHAFPEEAARVLRAAR